MAKRKLLSKKNAKNSTAKREKKRDERRTSAQHASQARWARKAVQSPNIEEATRRNEPTTSAAVRSVMMDQAVGTEPNNCDKATQTNWPKKTREVSTQTAPNVSLDEVFEMDQLSNEINKLREENRSLRISTPKSERRPLKSLKNVTPRHVSRIATQLVGELHNRRNASRSPSASRLLSQMSRMLEARLSPEEDLAITLAAGLSFKQREHFKCGMNAFGLDRLAATGQVKEFKKKWASSAKWEWIDDVDGKETETRNYYRALNDRGNLPGPLKLFKPTPKLHMLVAHSVKFAKDNGWWGFISEQGIEHLHALHNRLAVQYCNTGSKERTVEKLVKHQALLNALHDRGIRHE